MPGVTALQRRRAEKLICMAKNKLQVLTKTVVTYQCIEVWSIYLKLFSRNSWMLTCINVCAETTLSKLNVIPTHVIADVIH